MRRWMRISMRNAGALIALAVAASACVSSADPGVSIDSVEADVVFGIDEPVPAALPANTAVEDISDEEATVAYDPFRNAAARRLPPLNAVAESACPTAEKNAPAERAADAGITGEIEEGVYLWKRLGTQVIPNPDPEKPALQKKITGFERRIIRNVQPANDGFDENAYTFEMVQTLIDRPVVQVRTFKVKPQSSAQVTPGGAVVIDEPRANEPEGGISLIGIQEFDSKDQLIGSFDPTNGLLHLGLPVDPAETFQSTATDPKTGTTIVADAAVRGRARIDACGEHIDGWRVESTQERSDIGEVAYNAVFATQYGGMPILEEVSFDANDGSGSEYNVTFSLGQVHPDPLEDTSA